jgi:hypothetical protein
MPADEPRPDLSSLLDWLEDRLPPADAARVAHQVATGDARLRGTVEWLRGFLTTAGALPLHQPPPLVRQSLRQYFARWTRARAVLDQRPRELAASALFDSRKDLAVTGVRSAAPADETIHLAYTTESADVVLDVRRLAGGRVRIDGQVLLADPGSPPVFEASVTGSKFTGSKFTGTGFTARAVDGDELGRFHLPDVPAGRDGVLELRVSNGEIAIVASLDLRAGDA